MEPPSRSFPDDAPPFNAICPPSAAADVEPAPIVTEPPDPVFPLPEVTDISPPAPPVAAPVDTAIEPVVPAVDTPVFSDIAPLTPAVPAFTASMFISPLEVAVPRPLLI